MRGLPLALLLLLAFGRARADDKPVVFDEDPEEETPSMPPAQGEFVGPPEPPRPQGGGDDAGGGQGTTPAPSDAAPNGDAPSEDGAGSSGFRLKYYGDGGGSAAPGGGAAANAASGKSAGAAKGRSSGAGKAAARMAQQMKSMMPDAKAAAMAGDALKNAAAGLPGAGKPGATPPKAGAANPAPFVTFGGGPGAAPAKAPEAAAWAGPLKSLAESRGLSPYTAPDGSTAFRRRDGTPATAAEVSSLREAAAREPNALQKYPDFFRSISRQEFDSLRGEYRKNPDRPDFKDVDMTKDAKEDLVWKRSCESLSGDCNKNADSAGYKKNDYVKPETAKSIWKSIFAAVGIGADDEDEKKSPAKTASGAAAEAPAEEAAAEAPGESPRRAAAAAPAAAKEPEGAIASVAAAVKAKLGWGPAPAAAKPGEPAPPPRRLPWAWGIGLLGVGALYAARRFND